MPFKYQPNAGVNTRINTAALNQIDVSNCFFCLFAATNSLRTPKLGVWLSSDVSIFHFWSSLTHNNILNSILVRPSLLLKNTFHSTLARRRNYSESSIGTSMNLLVGR